MKLYAFLLMVMAVATALPRKAARDTKPIKSQKSTKVKGHVDVHRRHDDVKKHAVKKHNKAHNHPKGFWTKMRKQMFEKYGYQMPYHHEQAHKKTTKHAHKGKRIFKGKYKTQKHKFRRHHHMNFRHRKHLNRTHARIVRKKIIAHWKKMSPKQRIAFRKRQREVLKKRNPKLYKLVIAREKKLRGAFSRKGRKVLKHMKQRSKLHKEKRKHMSKQQLKAARHARKIHAMRRHNVTRRKLQDIGEDCGWEEEWDAEYGSDISLGHDGSHSDLKCRFGATGRDLEGPAEDEALYCGEGCVATRRENYGGGRFEFDSIDGPYHETEYEWACVNSKYHCTDYEGAFCNRCYVIDYEPEDNEEQYLLMGDRSEHNHYLDEDDPCVLTEDDMGPVCVFYERETDVDEPMVCWKTYDQYEQDDHEYVTAEDSVSCIVHDAALDECSHIAMEDGEEDDYCCPVAGSDQCCPRGLVTADNPEDGCWCPEGYEDDYDSYYEDNTDHFYCKPISRSDDECHRLADQAEHNGADYGEYCHERLHGCCMTIDGCLSADECDGEFRR